ncbi:putative integral membrane protein conserved region-domain-containing protein [Flammula alnicola]|nr:putative integral membrane protein conserved region-domain-containing protein [Flammula alnicola]
MLRALFYAYVLGGITFIPLLIGVVIFITIYTSVPVGDADVTKRTRGRLEASSVEDEKLAEVEPPNVETNDVPRTRKGWLTMRRTFEESVGDGGYVTLVRSFLDSRSKDPKKSRPKDMWYVVLKGKVLYLYEDEEMTECEAAVELSGHRVIIYPESLPDGELFAKRNAICLRPRSPTPESMPSVSKQMQFENEDVDAKLDPLLEAEKNKDATREEALDPSTPWFIFVRSNIEMEDWYFSLIHASEQPAQTPTLTPLSAIFDPAHMNHLVATLDEQPDVIPMRWLNALLGRIFLSHYRTHHLEAYIIGRLMKKLAKVKRPAFLTEISVTQVSVGNKAPMLSKPMLKELTKEGDASIEVHMKYKGEIRITVEATAVINLGARFKSYTVKLVLAAVVKEMEGNLLIKVKRPPSNRIWYAFTQTPRMVLEVEPIVSDRQITWGMILSTIESKFKEIIQESVVMPNMDDIAFFETGAYEHRGGIYSDACRKPHVSTTAPSPVAEDVQSVASAPLPDTTSISSGESLPVPNEDPSANPVERASSAMDAPSSTTTADDSTDSSRNNTRRRSWFATVRNEDMSASGPNFLADTNPAVDSEARRGRTTEPGQGTSPRSQSTPKPESVHAVTSEPYEKEGSDVSQSNTHLSPQSSRRSSSQHSIKVEQEPKGEASRDIRPKSTPTTPRKNSDASQTARSASPPSFFSTLKSKAAAADKQAISNTAKEAMRKWGVNWGGFKKDASSGDETSQPGTSPPQSILHPENNSFMDKARSSYAEVRAAVAERKARDRTSHADDSSDSMQPTSPTPRTRVVSNSKPTLPNGSVYSETPINPSM